MNSSIVELITIGLSIKISRSDACESALSLVLEGTQREVECLRGYGTVKGRVHSANVKAVHPEKGAVSVEWQENSATKGKEIEINELCHLNRELVEFLKSSSQHDPVPTQQNKYGTRLRSRISTLSEATVGVPSPEGSVPRRSVVRRTGLVPPVVVAPPSFFEAHGVIPEEPMSPHEGPGIPSGIPNSQRKHPVFANPPSSLPRVNEVVMESEAVARPRPHVRSTKRMSQAPLEAEKMLNKREVSQTKSAEIRAKRGRDVDTNRPHWQFYKMIEEYRANLETVPISTLDHIEDHRICVCVRKRPLNKQEVTKKEIDIVTVPGKGVMLVHEPKKKVDLSKYLDNQLFKFDYSFDDTATNDTLYSFTAKPLVKTIFEGGMATCFAYGQTGSGKTHTMGGAFSGKTQKGSNGIYALAAQDVFALLDQRRYSSMDLDPYVTFFEIYNGKVFDLLNKKARLRVLEDGKQQVQVVGLQEMHVSSASDVIKMINIGSACRTSGKTFANANSSRSHAVLQIILRQGARLHGKFSLVDLAGNERGTDVLGNDRQTLVETAEINRSLLALKECIRSLGKNSDHIPFRMSKLTQVLRDSFIGENSRTCMIAMISPGMNSCDYTLNTLRYADRVKELHGAMMASDLDSDKKTKMEVDEESLSEDDTDERRKGVYEAVSQVTAMEDEVTELMERANEFLSTLRERPAANIVAVVADFVDCTRKLHDSVQGLQAAVMMEECARI